MTYIRAYYAGGYRLVSFDGVPCRVARKPSEHDLKWSRAWDRYRAKPLEYSSRKERAGDIAKQARKTIEIYADMLEISETQARARIAAQRFAMTSPLVEDLSLEYDL